MQDRPRIQSVEPRSARVVWKAAHSNRIGLTGARKSALLIATLDAKCQSEIGNWKYLLLFSFKVANILDAFNSYSEAGSPLFKVPSLDPLLYLTRFEKLQACDP